MSADNGNGKYLGKQFVLLEVQYDDDNYDPPGEWDYRELLDVPIARVLWASDLLDGEPNED